MQNKQKVQTSSTELLGVPFPPPHLHGKLLFTLKSQSKNLTLHKLFSLYLTLLHTVHSLTGPTSGPYLLPLPYHLFHTPSSFGLHIPEFLELGLPCSSLL